MYLEFFELEESPFKLTPDASFLYLSKAHARAKAYMDYTIWNRDGFVVITGEIGSGKTTLIQHLLTSLDDNVEVARLYQTQLDEIQFFQAILVEFGFKPFNASKVELLDMLNTFLIEQYGLDRQVILIIDEAQNLSPRVLEEIRLLTGMETHKEKILNLILVGQPELKELMDAPGMEQLSQRIRFRFHLKNLTEEETREYIYHRLTIAGNRKDNLFHSNTIPLIYRYTGGTPRLINILCDTALICGFVDKIKIIDEVLIEAAIEELQWSPFSERAGVQYAADRRQTPFDHETVARLIDINDGNTNHEHLLTKDRTTLGRMPGNDIIINDEMVSVHHAKIINIHGNCFLEDLDSTNGTYVNSERIKKCVLKHGDRISLARYKLQYLNEPLASRAVDDSQVRQISGDTFTMPGPKTKIK